MATETKMGLGIIFILIVAFSVVVWKKVEHQKKELAKNEVIKAKEEDPVPAAPETEAPKTASELAGEITEIEPAKPGVTAKPISIAKEINEDENLVLDEPETDQTEETPTENIAQNNTEEVEPLELNFDDSEEEPSTEVAQNNEDDFFEEKENQLEVDEELVDNNDEFVAETDVNNIDSTQDELPADDFVEDEFAQIEDNTEELDEQMDLDEPLTDNENLEITENEEIPNQTEPAEIEEEFVFDDETDTNPNEEIIPEDNSLELEEEQVASQTEILEEPQEQPVAKNETIAETEPSIDFEEENTSKQVVVKDPFQEPIAEEPIAENHVSHEPNLSIHIVRNSDNFWSISKDVYGTSRYFRALAAHNRKRIPDPKKMRSGMKVLVPSRGILEQNYPHLIAGLRKSRHRVAHAGGIQKTSSKKPNGFNYTATGIPYFRIGGKDTLTGIAKRHLGRSSRWIQIYELNRNRLKNPHDLKIGMELRLPADASQVRLVDSESESR
jgi:nucleoid-associated protein YgaU